MLQDIIAEAWNNLLKYQTELTYNHDLQTLSKIAGWSEVTKIVDIGCGNGYYMNKLAAKHPGKDFFGIDISKPLIKIAKDNFQNNNKKFFNVPLESINSHIGFDFAISRLLLQHINDVNEYMNKISLLLKNNGKLTIFEALDHSTVCTPTIPIFTQTIEKIRALQSQTNKGMKNLRTLIDCCSQHGFSVEKISKHVYSPVSKSSKKDFVKLIYNLSTIIRSISTSPD